MTYHSCRLLLQRSILCSSHRLTDIDGLIVPWCGGAEDSAAPPDTNPGMASLGAGLHHVRKRGAGRSAVVERKNLLTVCRWGFLSALMTGEDEAASAAEFMTADLLILMSESGIGMHLFKVSFKGSRITALIYLSCDLMCVQSWGKNKELAISRLLWCFFLHSNDNYIFLTCPPNSSSHKPSLNIHAITFHFNFPSIQWRVQARNPEITPLNKYLDTNFFKFLLPLHIKSNFAINVSIFYECGLCSKHSSKQRRHEIRWWVWGELKIDAEVCTHVTCQLWWKTLCSSYWFVVLLVLLVAVSYCPTVPAVLFEAEKWDAEVFVFWHQWKCNRSENKPIKNGVCSAFFSGGEQIRLQNDHQCFEAAGESGAAADLQALVTWNTYQRKVIIRRRCSSLTGLILFQLFLPPQQPSPHCWHKRRRERRGYLNENKDWGKSGTKYCQ